MACEYYVKSDVCKSSTRVSYNLRRESSLSRVIPDTKWTVWCFEIWKFAPKFGHLRRENCAKM